jgi:hypothetical protein
MVISFSSPSFLFIALQTVAPPLPLLNMKQPLIIVLLCLCVGLEVVAFASPAISRKFVTARGTTTDGGSDAEKFRESAQKLRDEAQVLESKMDRKPASAPAFESPLAYTSLKESIWTLTYRFASDPNDENDNDEEVQPVSNYLGKLTVKLLSDGYTELLSHEPTGNARLELLKVWGWDKEVGEEDELDYVLFSTNIRVPDTDVAMPNEELRFYWQARVDTDRSSGALSLTDGTVTVKKDVKPPGGGFWGVFNGGGILAQFRYVGNFAAKAAAADQ